MTAILVLDIGTSGVRSAVVDETATIVVERFAEFLPDTPFDGIVEYDAVAYNALAISVARDVLEDYRQTPGVTDPEIDAIGISNQRASTVVWDRHTGVPVAPAQSWQDLRTIGDCLALQAAGHWTAPNQSITKAANIWNSVDPERERDLCVGTPDSWLVWSLTEGAAHITEPTNVALTGFCELSGVDWNPELLALVDISEAALPRIVDSSGELAWATVFGPGRDGRGIPICGIAGDQQASLIGQGGLVPINFNDPETELGYRLGRDHWGNGYATEIARATAAYGFERLRLDRLVAVCYEENLGSRRVLRKSGFRELGESDVYYSVRTILHECTPYDLAR